MSCARLTGYCHAIIPECQQDFSIMPSRGTWACSETLSLLMWKEYLMQLEHIEMNLFWKVQNLEDVAPCQKVAQFMWSHMWGKSQCWYTKQEQTEVSDDWPSPQTCTLNHHDKNYTWLTANLQSKAMIAAPIRTDIYCWVTLNSDRILLLRIQVYSTKCLTLAYEDSLLNEKTRGSGL